MVFQQFERGFAIYFPPLNQVFIFTPDTRVAAYNNVWVEGVPLPPPIAPPPAGRIVPIAQIGLVWVTQSWFDGRSLQLVLGYGTAPPQPYSGAYQAGAAADELFISTSDGNAYFLRLRGTGQWQLVGRVN